MQDADEHFKAIGQGRGPSMVAVRKAGAAAAEFCHALDLDALAACPLPGLRAAPKRPGHGAWL